MCPQSEEQKVGKRMIAIGERVLILTCQVRKLIWISNPKGCPIDFRPFSLQGFRGKEELDKVVLASFSHSCPESGKQIHKGVFGSFECLINVTKAQNYEYK